MQGKEVYEYAVIRVVPVVEREEFINVGVIVFCKSKKYIGMRYHLHAEKIKALKPDMDVEEIRRNLEAFQRIVNGEKSAGPIAMMEPAERFRWLTAVRSASIQTSRPHPGLCNEMEKTLDVLFMELVN